MATSSDTLQQVLDLTKKLRDEKKTNTALRNAIAELQTGFEDDISRITAECAARLKLADERSAEDKQQKQTVLESNEGLCKRLTNALTQITVLEERCAIVGRANDGLAEQLMTEQAQVRELETKLELANTRALYNYQMAESQRLQTQSLILALNTVTSERDELQERIHLLEGIIANTVSRKDYVSLQRQHQAAQDEIAQLRAQLTTGRATQTRSPSMLDGLGGFPGPLSSPGNSPGAYRATFNPAPGVPPGS